MKGLRSDLAAHYVPTLKPIKHYTFNGQPIAIRKSGVQRYTHTDHLGSSSGQTDTAGNAIVDSYLRYYAYGGLRSGILSASSTDRTYTGQKQDGTGLTAPSPPPTRWRGTSHWSVAPSSPSFGDDSADSI